MNKPDRITNDTATLMHEIGANARVASHALAAATTEQKNAALMHAAGAMRKATSSARRWPFAPRVNKRSSK